jgi:hypothetical protein
MSGNDLFTPDDWWPTLAGLLALALILLIGLTWLGWL